MRIYTSTNKFSILNFFLTFCKTRKKFDKYIKVNKIRNKLIIDIRAIIDDQNLDLTKESTAYYFKVLIYKKIMHAKEKNKDIYYLPNVWNEDFETDPLFKIRELLDDEDTFNLFLLEEEFQDQPEIVENLFDNLTAFDNTQILSDY